MGRFCFFFYSFHSFSFLFVSVVLAQALLFIVFRKYIHCHLSCDLGRSSSIAIGRISFSICSCFISFAYYSSAIVATVHIHWLLVFIIRALLILLHFKYCRRRTLSSCCLLSILCVFTLPCTLTLLTATHNLNAFASFILVSRKVYLLPLFRIFYLSIWFG